MDVPLTTFYFEKHEDDQMKSIASLYGKTLWTLKNNINIGWLQGLLNGPMAMLSFHKAINDFCTLDQWNKEYNNSEFKRLVGDHLNLLGGELKEKVADGKA